MDTVHTWGMADDALPEVVLPSGRYGIKRESGQFGAQVHIVELIGTTWHGTPGQWYAQDIVDGFAPISIHGDWMLNPADSYVSREFARQVVEGK